MTSYYYERRPCKVCGKTRFTVLRPIQHVGHADEWGDPQVCDACADSADKARSRAFAVEQLRRERRSKRRTHCKRCTKEFWFPRSQPTQGWPTYCPKCAARFRVCGFCCAKFETDRKEEFCTIKCTRQWRARSWWLTLPEAYQETEFDSLPWPEISRRIIEWSPDNDPGNPGLFVFGPSGAGKTRSILLKLRRFMEIGWHIRYLRSSEFARELINRTMPGGIGGAAAWLTELREVDVLCLDEVEKLKFTERVQAEFFELIEVRLHSESATILAGNVDPTKISQRMEEAYAVPFLRRITEFCRVAHFPPKPKR